MNAPMNHASLQRQVDLYVKASDPTFSAVILGKKAYVDHVEKIVVIPQYCSGDLSASIVARGFAVHEKLHIENTDFSIRPSQMTNACEDIRIEHIGAKKYPGAKKILAELVVELINQGSWNPAKIPEYNPVELLHYYVLWSGRTSILGHSLQTQATLARFFLAKYVGDEAINLIDEQVALLASATTTAVAEEIGNQIKRIARDHFQLPPEPPAGDPMPPEQQSEASNDAGDSTESNADGAGDSSPSKSNELGDSQNDCEPQDGANDDTNRPAESPENEASDPDDSDSNEPADEGDGPQDANDAVDDGVPPSQDDAGGSASGSAGGNFTPADFDEEPEDHVGIDQAMIDILEASAKDVDDILEATGEFVGVEEMLRTCKLSDFTDTFKDPLWLNWYVQNQRDKWEKEMNLGCASTIKSSLLAILQSQVMNRRITAHSGKRLDKTMLAKHRTTTKIFVKELEKPGHDTAIDLLLDMSHSMRSANRANVAFQSACILAQTLAQVRGVAVQISGFLDEKYVIIKAFNQRLDMNVLGALASRVDGGTLLSGGFTSSTAQLLQRKERRKVVWMITDAEVSDMQKEQIRQQSERLKRMNVLSTGIGIGADASLPLPCFKTVNAITDLPKAVIDIARSILL